MRTLSVCGVFAIFSGFFDVLYQCLIALTHTFLANFGRLNY
jgi:hypothetical protein